MGFEDEVEQSLGRPCRLTDSGSKRTVAAGAYNNGYYGYGPGYGYAAPDDGYYADPGYYDNGPRVYQRRYYNAPGS